jgi:heat shock protein HtpX
LSEGPGHHGDFRPPPTGVSAADEAMTSPEMRQRIKAYPGTLTYLDLIRKNKRDSTILIVSMILLATALAGAIAALIVVYNGGDYTVLIPSIVFGCVMGLIAAGLGATWSWFGGANAILRMSHASEITKELDPELYNVVDEMRIAAGLPMPRIFLVGDSAMNAFATGRDPEHGVIAITTGLRSRLSRDELQGVIAHEMAHIRHYDIRFAMLMATMVGLIAFACDAFFRVLWYGGGMRGGRRSGGSREGGGWIMIVILVLALLLAILAPIFARIIQMTYSRQREYLADAGAVELTRNPLGLASALQKLADDEEPLVDTANRGTAHMYIVNPLKKMRRTRQQHSSLFLSHPPIKDRIARLLALTR